MGKIRPDLRSDVAQYLAFATTIMKSLFPLLLFLEALMLRTAV